MHLRIRTLRRRTVYRSVNQKLRGIEEIQGFLCSWGGSIFRVLLIYHCYNHLFCIETWVDGKKRHVWIPPTISVVTRTTRLVVICWERQMFRHIILIRCDVMRKCKLAYSVSRRFGAWPSHICHNKIVIETFDRSGSCYKAQKTNKEVEIMFGRPFCVGRM